MTRRLVLLALLIGSPASAQRAITPGAGVIVETTPHDAAERGDVHPLLGLGMEWGGGGPALGVEALWSWIGGGLGDDHRLHVGGTATVPVAAGAFLKLGLGVGFATVVQIERPPPGGPPGDAVVGIGDEMTGDLLAGVGWAVPLAGRWSLVPAADLWVQRASSRTLRSLAISVGLRRRAGP